ncbi:ParB/RepB/Spo0J family partition protein [Fuerstiella marisgermanici]|uniref:Putative chromosome-partitioning protein ParB n=1 Tax=Fuerstiella marisgermanici TaxID=1891926 RepID=A0A1P8WKH2_9PLAN|nr:ParB/RepB/Spo0J family partition protein [Fuerstiella marisgermanici]APZ94550.1 putative chromosome-partitioning protein ParB [Fuerstiella marisgermanici]
MKPATIPTSLIDPDPDQPRQSMDQEELELLAENIGQIGQLQPIIVYRVGDRCCIADGHRRFAAMMLRQAKSINALVLAEKPPPDVLLLTQLAANCHRADLKPTELANSFQRLRDLKGWSNSEIARQLSVSKARVTQVMSYLKLPDNVKAMLDNGSLPGSTAYAISRAPDEATQQRMVTEAIQGKLKRDDASRRVTRKESATAAVRCRLSLKEASLVLTTPKRVSLDQIISISQELIRECRRAARQGIDVTTLERVLQDQRSPNAQLTATNTGKAAHHE